MERLALSEILGAPVRDSTGAVRGRVREVALAPQDNPAHIAGFVIRTDDGDRLVPPDKLADLNPVAFKSSVPRDSWTPLSSSEGLLLLERDLLDQQIIDVHGRKVVRVNDVDMRVEHYGGTPRLRITEVEVGPRGAVRRLLKGIVPRKAVTRLADQLSPKVIPWEFVDLIEVDPARRIRLRIEHERLSKLHPADIADILEELAPAQREAVFETLDEEVAAEALEEIDPKLQAQLVESLDSGRAADIVEEMDPDAAADLLENLPEERSEQILEEMEEEEREEVEELLEYEENTAAGRMTTDYVSVVENAHVYDVISLLRRHEGGLESLSAIYTINEEGQLTGFIPLAAIAMAYPDVKVNTLMSRDVVFCDEEMTDSEVAELFDKYNLLTLPVIDERERLTGVITADDVIMMLRRRVKN
ncbi:MAG TPA: CBS domain-containing protein [Terriglobales bacterium]|nr:CBS domain-containing protein [Terriglobales bacterium]